MTETARKDFILEQRTIFRVQNCAAFVIHSIALIACVTIVSLPFNVTKFTYNPAIILNNLQFKVVFGVVLGMGCLALFISIIALPVSSILPSTGLTRSGHIKPILFVSFILILKHRFAQRK